MPEEIARRCIRLYSFHGDVVLDPFTGSGTTLRVAKALGRRFVGYELMDSYSEIINTKLGVDVCTHRAQAAQDAESGLVIVGSAAPAELDVVAQQDCFSYLRRIADESVELACVDPPYNLGKGDWDSWKHRSDFLDFTESWLDALLPKLKPGAGLFVFNTPQNCAHILTFLESRGCVFQNWITWDKRDGFTATRRRFVPGQESIVYVTLPGARHTFNSDAVRVPYESTERIAAAASTGILKNGKRWYPNSNGRLCPDVWHITSERHKTKVNGRVQKSTHPTPKPLDLVERIVLAASNPGDTVLDCFAGTGMTAVAAVRHGRRFLACELSPEYAEIATKRVADEFASLQIGEPNGSAEGASS
jgi:site-specific DNA-methyltransferase (adenine-specific)